jgi:hypothetical protein
LRRRVGDALQGVVHLSANMFVCAPVTFGFIRAYSSYLCFISILISFERTHLTFTHLTQESRTKKRQVTCQGQRADVPRRREEGVRCPAERGLPDGQRGGCHLLMVKRLSYALTGNCCSCNKKVVSGDTIVKFAIHLAEARARFVVLNLLGVGTCLNSRTKDSMRARQT